jgi:glycosyltransferase involved in cell wall biosynthesis
MYTQNYELTVSVIIPVYNGERHLAQSIESVLNQSLRPDEIIVVDDGSTDHTARVAKSFSQVKYLYQDNQGPGGARNTGVKLASGTVLTFLDCDDLWTQDKLGCQIELLAQRPEIDMVFGQVEQFYSPELNYEPPGKLPVQTGLLLGSCAVRKTSFFKVGAFATRYGLGEFIDWYARAQEKGLVSHILHKVLLRRRLHKTNLGLLQGDKRADYARILKAALDRRRNSRSAMSEKAGSAPGQGACG